MEDFEGVLHGEAPAVWGRLSGEQVALLRRHWALVVEVNRRMNLTRISGDGEAARKHVLDSLAVLRAASFPPGARVADVGSGAGYPGVVLKIARPDLTVTLVESHGRRASFLERVCGEMGLEGLRVVRGRAEELARAEPHRAGYERVVARAVAPVARLAGWCLGLLVEGGLLVALKGPRGPGEAAAAAESLWRLGGRVAAIPRWELPGGAGSRCAVVVEKLAREEVAGGSRKTRGSQREGTHPEKRKGR